MPPLSGVVFTVFCTVFWNTAILRLPEPSRPDAHLVGRRVDKTPPAFLVSLAVSLRNAKDMVDTLLTLVGVESAEQLTEAQLKVKAWADCRAPLPCGFPCSFPSGMVDPALCVVQTVS